MSIFLTIVGGIMAYLGVGVLAGAYAIPRIMPEYLEKPYERASPARVEIARKKARSDALFVCLAWPAAVLIYSVYKSGLFLRASMDFIAPTTKWEKEAAKVDREQRIARLEETELQGKVLPVRPRRLEDMGDLW